MYFRFTPTYLQSYVEVNEPQGYLPIYYYGPHLWGYTYEYEVHWSSGNVWCALIEGDLKNCHDLGFTAPAEMQAWSEVYAYPQNQVDTNFSDVSYMDSGGTWLLFDQLRWIENAPYHVDKIQLYQYHNYGP